MPKRWRIELSLIEEEDGEEQVVASDPVGEFGDEDAARSGFEKKSDAAKKAGEGQ